VIESNSFVQVSQLLCQSRNRFFFPLLFSNFKWQCLFKKAVLSTRSKPGDYFVGASTMRINAERTLHLVYTSAGKSMSRLSDLRSYRLMEQWLQPTSSRF